MKILKVRDASIRKEEQERLKFIKECKERKEHSLELTQ